MDANKLDRRVTIQRKTVGYSASGEPTETWTNLIVRCPASMWPVKGDERFASPEKVASEQIEFKTRYSTDLMNLTPLDRIIHPALTSAEAADSTYVILTRSVHDVLAVFEIGRREGLKIITQRRADVTT